MPQSEMITLAHLEGNIFCLIKYEYKIKKNRAVGQISRQATGKRPGASNGQSEPVTILQK